MTKAVTIVGLGYVGLPVACLCAEKGIKVKPFKRKLGLEVITAPYTSYKITLAGYWLQNGTQKLRVDGEAKIFVK